jgi:Tol biopolymer transport system component
MPLATGTRLGPYQIVAAIGEGGMGEVYRAHDSRLERDVAIKIIPESLARDPDRVARFEREAKAVAALSHPNVLAVFDTGTVDGTLFVVMELLEGGTLRARLDEGGLPVRKAIEIAAAIARGLAAAHDRGLVHRDLKPENVFLTADGQVKILDFGLARPGAPTSHASETRAAITDAGTVVGTVGYMAPEQVRGHVVDARADLFALGAVLYEMIAGRRAFQHDTAAETMTAILKEDPPELSTSRPQITPALESIVRHCLEKNPAERFQTARDVAFALDALSGSTSRSGVSEAVPPARRVLTLERGLWAIAMLTLAGATFWSIRDRRPVAAPEPPVLHAPLLLPAGVSLTYSGPPGRRLAVSPDGRHVAFVGLAGAEGTAIWVHSLRDMTTTKIPGTSGAMAPVWDADNRTLGFVLDQRVMRVDTSGGQPIEIRSTGQLWGWRPDGSAVFSRDPNRDFVVLGKDAREQPILTAEPDQRIAYPTFLSDGRRFIYSLLPLDAAQAGFYVGDVDGARGLRFAAANFETESTNPILASGHLLSVRNGMIVARTFDDRTATVGADVHPVAGPVETASPGSAAFSASDNGVLVFQPRAATAASRLIWYDRNGSRLSTLGKEADYSNLELSPNGRSLLVSMTDAAARTRDIWMIDVARGIPTRLTFDPVDERSAVWTADGLGIIHRGQNGDLFQRPIVGGNPSPVVVDGRSKDPRNVAPDGAFIVYRVSGAGNDIYAKSLASADPPIALAATPFNEAHAELSPDGRWLAYVSDEAAAGEFDVYVTPFPSGGAKVRVSSAGGRFPRWRQDSKEIYYLSADRQMMSVPVLSATPAFTVGNPVSLFQTEAVNTPGSIYVVTPDGTRFLVNSMIPSTTPSMLNVIVNWPSLIPKK